MAVSAEIEQRMRRSAADFQEHVWPSVRECCGGGELRPVEGTWDEYADYLAGVDHWQIDTEHQRMRGLASRIQYGPSNWRSFTVRERLPSGRRTEAAKRLEAIRRGWLYPALTAQAYLEGSDLLGAAVVRTVDLYEWLTKYPSLRRRNPEDGVEFRVAWWTDLVKAGIEVKVVEGEW